MLYKFEKHPISPYPHQNVLSLELPLKVTLKNQRLYFYIKINICTLDALNAYLLISFFLIKLYQLPECKNGSEKYIIINQ